MNETILNPDTMRERKAAFFRHVQSRSLTFFTPDGEYRPQIVDSVDPEGVRLMAVGVETVTPTFFSATGMDPKLLQLFPDGRIVSQRRLVYDYDFVGSLFYKIRQHVLASGVKKCGILYCRMAADRFSDLLVLHKYSKTSI